MSVKLMSAIFETEFRDLKDSEGNTTKASTAKLVLLALADHANDEGEGAYPGLTKMERKTALSRQTIINTYQTLKYNGIIYLVGTSRKNTNNYSINTASFPRATADSQPTLLVNPLDIDSQPTLPEVVNPLDLNHTLTINEPSSQLEKKTDEEQGHYSTAYNRGEQEKPDMLMQYLQMATFPGAKKQERIDATLSYLGERLRRNTETKEWREFAKYIVNEQDTRGWAVECFVDWLLAKPDYKPDYWSVKRMKEFYPMAFDKPENSAPAIAPEGGVYL
jgi:hypothetical protein